MGRPRKDFAIIHYRAFTDDRFKCLGAALVKMKLALPVTASDTARSVAQRLWIHLLRLNDRRGVLPGDGVEVARQAFGLGPPETVAILAAMTKVDLLAKENGSLRVRGFEEAYRALYRDRDRDRQRKHDEFPAGNDGVSVGFPGGNPAGNDGVSVAKSAPTVAVAVTGEEEATAKSEEESQRGNDPAPGPGKKKRDLRTPVERLLGEKGIHLSGRGGCAITAWRLKIKAATKAGAPDAEVAAVIETSNPLDTPWDALQPITNRYGKESRRGPKGFRIPAGAPKVPPGESYGEGTRVNIDEGEEVEF